VQKKSDLLAEQVQEMKLYTDTILINHNQITVLNTELNKLVYVHCILLYLHFTRTYELPYIFKYNLVI